MCQKIVDPIKCVCPNSKEFYTEIILIQFFLGLPKLFGPKDPKRQMLPRQLFALMI